MKLVPKHLLAPLALLLAMPACTVTHRDFRPVERSSSEALTGHPAAEYDLGRDGTRWGEVRVWSEGVTYFEKEPAQTLLHLGFEVENVLDEPLALDLDVTRLVEAEGIELSGELAPLDATGVLEAPPHSVRRFAVEFVLPDGVMPDDVEAFQARWNLIGPGDWRYEQYTGFRRKFVDPPMFSTYPYWGWSPFAVGFRWGPGWCW